MLREHRADRLDTPTQTIAHAAAGVLVDELHEGLGGRSSSAAKKTEAARLSHEPFFMCVHWFAA
jgi:hypothetical protein